MNEKMKIKTIAAIVIIAIVIPPLMFGGWLLKVLEVLIALGAAYEGSKVVTGKADYFATVLCFASEMAMMIVSGEKFGAVIAIWLVVLFVNELAKGKVATCIPIYDYSLDWYCIEMCR